MNRLEVIKLLTIASAFDRFMRQDEGSIAAWHAVLDRVPYELAEKAVLAHYAGPDAHRQLMPANIIRAVEREARLTPAMIEEDVRSAKARGLVAQSWPDRKLLDEDVRQRLFAARRGDLQLMIEGGAE